jgi:hypothetical protein
MIVRLLTTREAAGVYQRGALVERVDDPRRPSYRALSAIPVTRSIVAHCSRLDQIWSWSLLRRTWPGPGPPEGSLPPAVIRSDPTVVQYASEIMGSAEVTSGIREYDTERKARSSGENRLK